MTCWLLLNEAAATFCGLTVWWAVDKPVGSWTRMVPNYWERQNYGLLALAWWKSARKAKDCLSFRERISMSRRQRLVFLESVPSFVRCFSCALGPPNTGCHRKQTNIHLFHSFSWHLEKKEQRNSKRDDDGASRWVAAWASTVASCYSDIRTGKRQNIWRAGDTVMFVILPLLSEQGLVKASLLFYCIFPSLSNPLVPERCPGPSWLGPQTRGQGNSWQHLIHSPSSTFNLLLPQRFIFLRMLCLFLV